MTVTTDRPPQAEPITTEAWYASVGHVMRVARSFPGILPFPHTTDSGVSFFLRETFTKPAAPQVLAAAEEILSRMLGVTFTEHPDPAPRWYVLSAALPGGLEVRIHAWGSSVAREVGRDAPRWERLPVNGESA